MPCPPPNTSPSRVPSLPTPSACVRLQGFEGRRKRDWDRLYTLASAVLGPSLTKRMLLRLVRSYLGV